jgi:hypothetical protein
MPAMCWMDRRGRCICRRRSPIQRRWPGNRPSACVVVYYRPIFLISFLKEVFLRSVILFHSNFCFIRKNLRFRLRSFVQVTPENIHHPRRHENGQRLAGNVAYSDKCPSLAWFKRRSGKFRPDLDRGGRLEVSTGSGTPANEPSTMREALQFCPLSQEKLAELLLNNRLQMRVSG